MALIRAPQRRIRKLIKITLATNWIAASLLIFCPTPARAQHGDSLLGSFGFQGATQPPEGLYYMNQFSYYHTSSSGFVNTGPVKCGQRRGLACLGANFDGTGSLDLFIDANIVTWTSPFRVAGANYGVNLIVPFAIADANGAATLQPVLILPRRTLGFSSLGNAGGVTKGSIGDIYVEPVNLGWHFRQLDLMVSSAFFAPSGPYNAKAKLNIGFGHWTGVFGLGAVALR